MKPILAIDLGGALMYSRPFKEAHNKWFEFMAKLLGDDSIKSYAKVKNYFKKVHKVMKKYLGNVNEKTRVEFARNLYSMVTVAEVNKKDLVKEFFTYLKKLKKNYKLVLITTAPESSVDPILEKLRCDKLFDEVYKSRLSNVPNKKQMLENFIKKNGKPQFYIGDGDEHITACKELGVSSISVNWVNKAQIKGDYDIKRVKELKKILE